MLVGGGTCNVCLKMLSDHFNDNADIYNIVSVYMVDAGAQTTEKPNYKLIDQDMERQRERDR